MFIAPLHHWGIVLLLNEGDGIGYALSFTANRMAIGEQILRLRQGCDDHLNHSDLKIAKMKFKLLAKESRQADQEDWRATPPPASKESSSMTETDPTNTYEQRARAIQLASQPILDGFERWLKQAGWSEKTIQDHVDNMRFFTKYLAWYSHSQHRLDEATDSDVYWFLGDWFPRKALWASVASTKGYLASFKKFFTWMGETGLVSPQTVVDVLDTLKFDRDEFLRNVAE